MSRRLGAVDFDAAADRYGWGTWGPGADPCAPPPPWVLTFKPWEPPDGCEDDDEPIDIGLEERMEVVAKPPQGGGGGGLLLLGLLAVVVLSD